MSATATAPSHAAPTPSAESIKQATSEGGKLRQAWWSRVLHAVPGLAVFALLGGVLYVGHHTGWKMPRMSQLPGNAAIEIDDWCGDHLVPESKCIECRTDLLPKGESFGFCNEHGVTECVIHHPELAQVRGDVQLPKYDTVAAISLIARPENNSRNTLHQHRVQFASPESITKAGIDVDVVQERSMLDAVVANGELVFNPTRVAHLSARVAGTVAFVFRTVGDQVTSGEILALIDSAQVGQAKAQLVQSLVQLQLQRNTVERLRPLASGGALPHRSLMEAEAALQEAEIAFISAHQALANLGFDVPDGLEKADARQVAEDLRFLGIELPGGVLPRGTKTANLIPVKAPYGGAIVAADAVAGEVVDPSGILFTVADPARMWLLLSVRQEDAKYVRLGLPVTFETDDGAQEVTGSISWISPAVDEQTRTLQVRIVIDNTDGHLRDNTFGTGRIILRNEPHAVVVPRNAVQSTTDAHFVFVRDKHYFTAGSPKFFHVRQVRIGARDDQYIELLAGVLPGEVVATKGSGVLLGQLLRSNLGAGCGCHED